MYVTVIVTDLNIPGQNNVLLFSVYATPGCDATDSLTSCVIGMPLRTVEATNHAGVIYLL